MSALPFALSVCPSHLRTDALRCLHDSLPDGQRPLLVHALNRLGPSDQLAWQGLFIAARDESQGRPVVTACTWVQPAPGNVAVIWPPPSHDPLSDQLLLMAAEYAKAQRIPLAQLLVASADGYADERLVRAGFTRLAELLFLFIDLQRFPNKETCEPPPTAPSLQFIPFAGDQLDRLTRVIERTYCDTRDCPAIDGMRDMQDVLEGYRAQGEYLPKHWYFVQSGGADVGALILASHPGAGNWELVYMGVAPEVRGRGVGDRIVSFAVEQAARGGAGGMVLAVDAANDPAIEIYRRAGFVEWDRRTAFAAVSQTENDRSIRQ